MASGEQIARFHSLLFGTLAASPAAQTSVTSLWAKGRGAWHIPLVSTDAFVGRAVALEQQNADVYVGIAPRVPTLLSSARGDKTDCIALPALFADVDVGTEGHAAKNLPASPEEALSAMLDSGAPVPTFVVWSGGGVHPYWVLTDPPIFGPGYNHAAREAEAALKALNARIGQGFIERGWQFDHQVAELARVLRIPGTRNYKLTGNPRDCFILDDSGPRYAWKDLCGMVGASGGVAASVGSQVLPPLVPPSLTGDAAPPDALTPPPPAPPKEKVISEIRGALERISQKTTHKSADAARRILRGEPLAAPGARDAELHRAASLCAWVAPDNARAEDIVLVLEPSLAAMQQEPGNTRENPAPTVWDALAKIRRASEDRAHERAGLDDVAKGLGLDPNAQAHSANEVVKQYSAEDLAKICAELDCTLEELSRRWVIQRSSSYYVFGLKNKYEAPISTEDLEVSLPRDLARAPISWSHAVGGQIKPCTAKDILRKHATVARHVIADLTISRSRYDAESQTFFEAVAPFRKLEPRFDERIDHWLRLLGGEEAEKLLDWLATVTDLSYQNSALYIEGEDAVGKGMLAAGLARLWEHAEGLTPLGSVLGPRGNFNANLINCPLVWADEQLPEHITAADLRAFIAVSSRNLSRKFLSDATLRGAIRLLLTSNSDTMLHLGDQDLNYREIRASAGRFVHIHAGPAAREYLESIEGIKSTRPWTEENLIARHALWLRANRKVQHGTRFLVEGRSATDMLRKLATQSKASSLVCEWLARFLDDTTNSPGGPEGQQLIRVGNGHLLVNTVAVTKFWNSYIESDDVPTTTRIGKVLASWAVSGARIGGRRFHEIPSDIVLGWARDYQIGNIEYMQQRVLRAVDMSDVQMDEDTDPQQTGLLS